MLLELREHRTIIERIGLENQNEHAILRTLQAVRFCYQKDKNKNNMEYEIFSKRQQRMQVENPDTYQYETIPDELRIQIFYIWEKVWEAAYENSFGELQLSPLAIEAYTSIETTLRGEYGVLALDGVDDHDEDGYGFYSVVRKFLLETEDTDKVIDVIEVSFRYIDQVIRDKFYVPKDDGPDEIFGPRPGDILPDGISPDEAIDQLNRRFREHSVGYQYESGQIVEADSQDTHSEVVKPAEELPNDTQQTVNNSPMNNENKKYFIGHGGSPEWLKLRDFLEKTLGLPYEEFNRIPQAGKITSIRLKEMLESCCMAFLIMTGEDEHTDGTRHARGNVIHEIGLFQAQLGYERAIILLEDGCEIFSNIQGITYIPFPKGNIKAAFEDIRQVLERESIM